MKHTSHEKSLLISPKNLFVTVETMAEPKLSKLLFLTVVLAVLGVKADTDEVKTLHWNSTELQHLRSHILRAYFNRPEPLKRCDKQDHVKAMEKFTTKVSAKQQGILLNEIHYSIIYRKNDFFLGLAEVFSALDENIAKTILISDETFVNVVTYRSILTGRSETFPIPFSSIGDVVNNYTDTDTGLCMEIVECLSLPEWIYKNYNETTRPQPIAFKKADIPELDRNYKAFLKMSGGIAGKLSREFIFGQHQWLYYWLRNTDRLQKKFRKGRSSQ